VPIWSFEFDDPDAPQIILPPVSYPYGAYHGSELQYLFDVREPIPGNLSAAQQRLSDAMILHWSNFVRFGNPNTLQTSGWPRYQPPQTDRVQLLTTPVPQAYTQTAFRQDQKCAFWDSLLQGGGS
jgi:para-nitrobenzyl esterase